MPRVDSRQIRLLLSLGLVLGLGATATYAAWTNPAAVSGTTISTARVDLQVQNQDTVTGYADLSATALEPGSSTAGVLTVKTAGSSLSPTTPTPRRRRRAVRDSPATWSPG